MKTDISAVCTDLQKVADDTRAAFGSLSVAQLNWKPSTKSWSVAQCLEHVINTHSLYFPIFDRLARGEYKFNAWERYSPLTGLFGKFLIRVLDPASTWKMKTTGKAHPSASEIGADIVDRYVEHQLQMIEQLKRFPPDFHSRNAVIQSPLLKLVTYTVEDYTTILIVHSQRHFLQAKRVTESEGFPK